MKPHYIYVRVTKWIPIFSRVRLGIQGVMHSALKARCLGTIQSSGRQTSLGDRYFVGSFTKVSTDVTVLKHCRRLHTYYLHILYMRTLLPYVGYLDPSYTRIGARPADWLLADVVPRPRTLVGTYS